MAKWSQVPGALNPLFVSTSHVVGSSCFESVSLLEDGYKFSPLIGPKVGMVK